LPDAEAEVHELAQLYGPSRTTVLLGREAREDVFKEQAVRYDVIHLATHGVFDDTSPMYSYLALARAPAPGDDGLLEAWEVMALKLQARVVVLSACQTARGRLSPGEGLTGMAWAFFLAGCPTTVAGLWSVDSASAADLMVEFHRHLWRAGSTSTGSAAEALRQAALRQLRSGRRAHPFYWASFIVIGDGRQPR
jgi:CHAT domain-containing protein